MWVLLLPLENKVNSYSNQLKLNWVYKLEWNFDNKKINQFISKQKIISKNFTDFISFNLVITEESATIVLYCFINPWTKFGDISKHCREVCKMFVSFIIFMVWILKQLT